MSDSDRRFEQFLAAPRTFVRIYRLPIQLTDGFCFGGAKPIVFHNVDWFEAPVADGRDRLVAVIKQKKYYRDDARFLVLGDDPDFVFTIEPVKVRSRP